MLHCARFFYLDSSSGAAVANRMLMECLSRRGFAVKALCGTVVEAAPGGDPAVVLTDWDSGCRPAGGGAGDAFTIGPAGFRMADPPHLVATIGGVSLTSLRHPLRRDAPTDPAEAGEFLSLFDAILIRFRPDVLVTYGGDPMTLEILERARRAGVATVFTLHNFGYRHAGFFGDVDTILVPSRFSADYHRGLLGIDCVALPSLIDASRVQADREGPGYVTFVNASAEKGVFVFARIADELGRCRPEIPLLVVESRGTEANLVGCGVDLRPHGNVFLMAQTADPRDFWRVTRIALMPSLCWESQGLVAVEAMVNGIPVIGSDRGALPETLGTSGIALSLPARLTPLTREMPTADEVAPWVEAIIRLWDDHRWYAEQSRRALVEGRRWAAEVLEPRYVAFFEGLHNGVDSAQ